MEELITNSLFFSRRRFVAARELIPLVKMEGSSERSRWYKVGEFSVKLDNLKMNFSCNCNEGVNSWQGSLCPHVLAVIAWEVTK